MNWKIPLFFSSLKIGKRVNTKSGKVKKIEIDSWFTTPLYMGLKFQTPPPI